MKILHYWFQKKTRKTRKVYRMYIENGKIHNDRKKQRETTP
jgi:hypothetical protein